jgi:hypothetical protein
VAWLFSQESEGGQQGREALRIQYVTRMPREGAQGEARGVQDGEPPDPPYLPRPSGSRGTLRSPAPGIQPLSPAGPGELHRGIS